MNSATRLLLFDLGGVVIEVDTAGIRALDGHGRSDVELWEIWLTTPVVQQYESGKIGNADFARGVLSAFKSDMEPDVFLRSFTAWTLGFYPGVKELLHELRKKYKLAFLSNSNPLHYPRFQAEWGLNDYFDYHFVSHEMGCVKPQAEIFEDVLKALPYSPQEILFFDDNRLNTEAALRAGIPAYITRGPDELRHALMTAGCISA
ncbi:MAG: HAD-IA family hydrolase [Turneriella sp.]|nr:HAD-IA family hydrolase [Turneriella sp.]